MPLGSKVVSYFLMHLNIYPKGLCHKIGIIVYNIVLRDNSLDIELIKSIEDQTFIWYKLNIFKFILKWSFLWIFMSIDRNEKCDWHCNQISVDLIKSISLFFLIALSLLIFEDDPASSYHMYFSIMMNKV